MELEYCLKKSTALLNAVELRNLVDSRPTRTRSASVPEPLGRPDPTCNYKPIPGPESTLGSWPETKALVLGRNSNSGSRRMSVFARRRGSHSLPFRTSCAGMVSRILPVSTPPHGASDHRKRFPPGGTSAVTKWITFGNNNYLYPQLRKASSTWCALGFCSPACYSAGNFPHLHGFAWSLEMLLYVLGQSHNLHSDQTVSVHLRTFVALKNRGDQDQLVLVRGVYDQTSWKTDARTANL